MKRKPKMECTAAVVRLYGRKKENKPDTESTQKLTANVRLIKTLMFMLKLLGLACQEFNFFPQRCNHRLFG